MAKSMTKEQIETGFATLLSGLADEPVSCEIIGAPSTPTLRATFVSEEGRDRAIKLHVLAGTRSTVKRVDGLSVRFAMNVA